MQNTYCDECGKRAHPGECESAVVSAETVNQTFKIGVDVPAERFWVRDKNGDDIQIRLESSGMIYVCYTEKDRTVIESREITWDYFARSFRSFVDRLGDGPEAE